MNATQEAPSKGAKHDDQSNYNYDILPPPIPTPHAHNSGELDIWCTHTRTQASALAHSHTRTHSCTHTYTHINRRKSSGTTETPDQIRCITHVDGHDKLYKSPPGSDQIRPNPDPDQVNNTCGWSRRGPWSSQLRAPCRRGCTCGVTTS